MVGDTAWVAESGKRRVARVDLKRGEVVSRVAVGRLPVQVVASPAGAVYTLAHTDQTVWAIDGQTARARALARLPDYPEDMVVADGALWVLLDPEPRPSSVDGKGPGSERAAACWAYRGLPASFIGRRSAREPIKRRLTSRSR